MGAAEEYRASITAAYGTTQAMVARGIAAGIVSPEQALPEIGEFEQQAVALWPIYQRLGDLEVTRESRRNCKPVPTMVFVPHLTSDQWNRILSTYETLPGKFSGLDDALRALLNSETYFDHGRSEADDRVDWNLTVMNTNDCLFESFVDWKTLGDMRRERLIAQGRTATSASTPRWRDNSTEKALADAAAVAGLPADHPPLDVVDTTSPSLDAYCAMQWLRLEQGVRPVTGRSPEVRVQSDTLLGRAYSTEFNGRSLCLVSLNCDSEKIGFMSGGLFGLEHMGRAPGLRFCMGGREAIAIARQSERTDG